MARLIRDILAAGWHEVRLQLLLKADLGRDVHHPEKGQPVRGFFRTFFEFEVSLPAAKLREFMCMKFEFCTGPGQGLGSNFVAEGARACFWRNVAAA